MPQQLIALGMLVESSLLERFSMPIIGVVHYKHQVQYNETVGCLVPYSQNFVFSIPLYFCRFCVYEGWGGWGGGGGGAVQLGVLLHCGHGANNFSRAKVSMTGQ